MPLGVVSEGGIYSNEDLIKHKTTQHLESSDSDVFLSISWMASRSTVERSIITIDGFTKLLDVEKVPKGTIHFP